MAHRTVEALSRLLALVLVCASACARHQQPARLEEITFQSGPFNVTGELRLPAGRGPFPVVLFVHGDGPNDRTSGGTYTPIMARMASAGFATFAWDKPGTGESTGRIDRSRLGEQRARIVLDAIRVMKARDNIDRELVGLWGISQAGYVMPRVLSSSDDVAFVIAVSCPGMAGADQGAFLVSAQAVCAGVPTAEAKQMRRLLSAVERVGTYQGYVEIKGQLDSLPGVGAASIWGFKPGIVPEDDWHAPNPDGEYFWNPMESIEQVTIPVLAFFGELDTLIDPVQGAQAYRAALERSGSRNFQVEIVPGTDHNIIVSETGCLYERENRPQREWTNYAPAYLDLLEEWLRRLKQ